MSKQLDIYSAYEISAAIGAVISDIASCSGELGEANEFNIKLVLSELLANSIEHSRCDHARVLFGFDGSVLRCCVMDGGCGFSETKRRLAQCPGVESMRGRGLFLIGAIADSIRYNKKGNIAMFSYCI